jgi:hypothetical protein
MRHGKRVLGPATAGIWAEAFAIRRGTRLAISAGMLPLPLLALSLPLLPAPEIHLATHAEIEDAITADVHAYVAAGWSPTSYTGFGTAVAVAHGGLVVRFVAEIDDEGGGSYRKELEVTELDPSLFRDRFVNEAMTDPAGRMILVDDGCTHWSLQPVIDVARAEGEAAATLVARTLRKADNLDSTLELEDGDLILRLQRGDDAQELVIDRGEDGVVIAAALRRVEGDHRETTYKRMRAMRRAMRGAAVTSIVYDEDTLDTILVTRRGRFGIDPRGNAFDEPVISDEEHGGCGC